MPATYFIIELDVHNMAEYQRYGSIAGPTVAKHGGKALVLGGKVESVEGDWNPKWLVVLEFPNGEAARNWYNSAEYQDAVKIRFGAAASKAVFVEGL